jgi:hypothetical protein
MQVCKREGQTMTFLSFNDLLQWSTIGEGESGLPGSAVFSNANLPYFAIVLSVPPTPSGNNHMLGPRA